MFIPEQKSKNTTRKVVLRVFLAHTETGSTGNLAESLAQETFGSRGAQETGRN